MNREKSEKYEAQRNVLIAAERARAADEKALALQLQMTETLEEKVRLRTLELTEANSILEKANKQTERDLNMAANVQRALFVIEPPAVPGWDIAVEFRPYACVSGDLYDFYLESGRLEGMTLLDVSGHGIASALITMIAKPIFFRNFFRYKKSGLIDVLEHANRNLAVEINNVGHYLTGVVLRFRDSTVDYVNAGHPDLLVREDSSGEVRAIDTSTEDLRAGLLGFDSLPEHWGVMQFHAATGDALLVYSDGIIEGRNRNDETFDYRGLIQAFTGAPRDSAAAILSHIMNEFPAFM